MHISSGLDALKAAKKVSGKIKLIGVTVLTSLDAESKLRSKPVLSISINSVDFNAFTVALLF